ncbi:unnamed protein product, partial [Ranitomeya imitator]
MCSWKVPYLNVICDVCVTSSHYSAIFSTECSLRGLDIAFLIDGSGSITVADFQLMLDFITTIMEDFSDSNTQFALMQYSKEFETHFYFTNFSKIRDPKSLTSGITHQQGKATRTCTAILEA